MDRAVDPVALDFIDDSGGAFAYDDDLAYKLGLIYTTPLGSWEGDPQIGNRLGELVTFDDDWRQKAEAFLREPCDWLIASGELDHIDVTVERQARDLMAFEVRAYPPGATKPVTYASFVPVGAG